MIFAKIILSDDKKTVTVFNARTGNIIETLVAWSYFFGDNDDVKTNEQLAKLNKTYNS